MAGSGRIRRIGRTGLLRLAAAAVVVLLVLGAAAFAVTRGSSQTLLDVTLAQLEEEVRQDPQNPQKRLAVAIAYAARGYNGSAITQFEEALTLDEDNQTALMGLGRLYLQEGQMDKALDPLLRVAELNKDNPFRKTLEQLEAVYYDLGLIYLRKGAPQTAADYLLQALEINSADADAWYLLGRAQQEAGQDEAALASYQQAVRFVPDFVEAYRGMSEIYGKLGRAGERRYATGMIHLAGRSFQDAARDLQEATTAVPTLAEAHQGLAIALEAQGKRAEAVASYERALELDPDLLIARLAVQRLGGR